MNSKMLSVIRYFQNTPLPPEVFNAEISGRLFDAVFFEKMTDYKVDISAKRTSNRWMPDWPPVLGYYSDNMTIYAAIRLPTAYEEKVDDNMLLCRYNIPVVHFEEGLNAAFMRISLAEHFTVDNLYNETIDAQEKIARIFGINTSLGIIYVKY